MKKEANLYHILEQFAIDTKIIPYGAGHISGTYSVEVPRLLLQKVNTDVFKNPEELMENIEHVTEFLKRKIIANGGDPERETLSVIKTKDGKNYYRDEEDRVYRVLRFIEGTKIVEEHITYKDLYHAGKGFGKFQYMLRDFPVEILHETIPNFHNTPKRVQDLEEAIEKDRAGRAGFVKKEIQFVLEHAFISDQIVTGIQNGEVLIRVTHNDTKINNILFDCNSGEAICVIDLDTVMPGSVLYDFGDALRVGASTGAEDETDLEKVHFDLGAFRSFTEGYLGEMKEELTDLEKELLPISAAILTYECGIRFLTDYLNGDTYFKVQREHHNLERARNQFKLVHEILEKLEDMKQIMKELV